MISTSKRLMLSPENTDQASPVCPGRSSSRGYTAIGSRGAEAPAAAARSTMPASRSGSARRAIDREGMELSFPTGMRDTSDAGGQSKPGPRRRSRSVGRRDQKSRAAKPAAERSPPGATPSQSTRSTVKASTKATGPGTPISGVASHSSFMVIR